MDEIASYLGDLHLLAMSAEDTPTQEGAMQYEVVGNCPQCGCPIYADKQAADGPPRSVRTCLCVPASVYATTSHTCGYKGGGEATGIDYAHRYDPAYLATPPQVIV